MFLNDLWYKEDLRFQAETQPDWCLGASRCGGNALSRDGLLRSTPGWWGQQYHGAFFDMSRTFAHLLLGKPCDSAECFARSQRLRNGMVSPDTGNTERDDLKGTRPNLGRWHPKSHYRIPCVSATAIIQEIPLSASALTPEVRAQSRFGHHWWDPFARTGAPFMKHRWMMFLQLFFLICLLFVWYHDAPTIHAILYRFYIDGSIPTTTLLLVKGRGVDQCGGWMWKCFTKFDSTIRLCHIDSFRSTMLYYMLCSYNIYFKNIY